jgi:hypothetical protein
MTVKIRLIREVRGIEVPLARISDPDLVEVAVRRLMRKLGDEVYADPFQKAAAEIEKRRMLEHLAAEGYLPDDDGEGVSNGG